jgi:hypothetical protein
LRMRQAAAKQTGVRLVPSQKDGWEPEEKQFFRTQFSPYVSDRK